MSDSFFLCSERASLEVILGRPRVGSKIKKIVLPGSLSLVKVSLCRNRNTRYFLKIGLYAMKSCNCMCSPLHGNIC